jgi:geranylgeranyl pyrophosphate synthase
MAKMAKEVDELRAKVKALEEQKRVLETDNDTLEQKARALESADEALRWEIEYCILSSGKKWRPLQGVAACPSLGNLFCTVRSSR